MYSTTTYKQPFWAENSGFMTGRDPLGIQNSSITLYGKLLPGMTNLTLRLRYYGLYCWLLSEYDNISDENKTKNLEHQYNFIRRAELTIAYIMINIDSSQQSVIGSDYATKNFEEVKLLGFYQIEKGADKFKNTPKGTVYWDFVSGALGQYYIGSLINLGLAETSNKFFLIKERGRELASAFQKSIPKATRDLFLNVLSKGKLTLNEIDNLHPFALNGIPNKSDELNFYKQMLIEEDGEKFNTSDKKISRKRRETIKLYLDFIGDNSNEIAFDQYQYLMIKNGNRINDSSFGWYYYFIIEIFHYAIESMFWAMLVELDGKIIPVHDYINQIVDTIVKQTNEDFEIQEDQTLLEILTSFKKVELIHELNDLEELNKSVQNSKQVLGFAVVLIFQTYLNIESKEKEIVEFENLNYLTTQNGIISDFLKNYMINYLESDFRNYLERIVKMIINDHIATAYRKMGRGESNLLKFVIEDGLIGHIQTMQPKHTNPRIRTLHNFLVDLYFITQDRKISKEGVELVSQISN